MPTIDTWNQPIHRRPGAGAAPPPATRAQLGPPSVAQAVEAMTAECYGGGTRTNARALLDGGRFRAFLQSRGIARMNELSRRDMRAFHEGLRDVVAPETRNKYRQYLNRLIEWCQSTPGYGLAPDPATASARDLTLAKAKVPKDEVRVITDDEEVRLRRAIRTARDEAVIDTLLATGMRPGELCGLAVGDCHLTQAAARTAGCNELPPHLHVRRSGVGRRTTKDFEARVVPVLPRGARRLGRWLEKERPTTRRLEVFGSVKRDPAGQDLPLTVNTVQSLFQRLSREAHIEPSLVPYDTRHTWATRLADEGYPPLRLVHAGGWADLQMVMRYYRFDTKSMLQDFNQRFRG